jgi:hypothetical protein
MDHKCPRCARTFSGSSRFCPYDGAPLESPAAAGVRDPLAGILVADRYRLEERIGEGGMGTVYRAVHVLLDRPVALKILRDDLPAFANPAKRFQREARAASGIDHENVIRILDFGRADQGFLYLVMEFVEGDALSGVLAREGTLHPGRAVDLATQIAGALEAAAELGIVHRDLKPENILLTRRGDRGDFVKILDFGLAKLLTVADTGPLTISGNVFGTPAYMSPEQCKGAAVDVRSDIYALGILLYEMIAGTPPWTGSYASLFRAQLTRPPPPIRATFPEAQCPPALEVAILRCLEKDPAARFQTPAELRAALEAVGLPRPGGKPGSLRRRAGDGTLARGVAPTLAVPAAAPPSETFRADDSRETDTGEEGLEEQLGQLRRRREESLVRIAEMLHRRGHLPAAGQAVLVAIRRREGELSEIGEQVAVAEAEVEEAERASRELAASVHKEIAATNLSAESLREDSARLDAEVERLRAALSEVQVRVLSGGTTGPAVEARDEIRRALAVAESASVAKTAEVFKADMAAKDRARELGAELRAGEERVAKLEGTLKARLYALRETETDVAQDYEILGAVIYDLDELLSRDFKGPYGTLRNLDREITQRAALLALQSRRAPRP